MEYRLAQSARAASNIQPASAGREVEPIQEFARDQTAPASNVGFVSRAALPLIGSRDRLSVVAQLFPRHLELRIWSHES